MNVLDLCAGTGSATQAFQDRGHDVDTLDIIGGHTFNIDVRKFKPWKKYDFIWASPPCTCFSVAGLRVHWKNHKPQPKTLEAIEILKACIRICQTSKHWIIENPRGMMRKLDIMKPLYRTTITYCQYGFDYMKPTDLFSNNGIFKGKCCNYGDSCHHKTPRGSRDHGVQSYYSNDPRKSMIPYELSLAVCKAIEKEIKINPP